MNILVTGNLFSLAKTIAREFSKEKHKIVVASDGAKASFDLKNANVTVHDIHPAEPVFLEVLSSYKFDVVIYLTIREEQIISQFDKDAGNLLNGLRNTLDISKRSGVEKFILLSSTEIYGNMDELLETEIPNPASLNGYALYASEKYCDLYKKKFGLNSVIIRVPFVYGPEEKASFVHDLLLQCSQQDEIIIPINEDRACSFLHANDVTDFIFRVVNEEYHLDYSIINLSSSTDFTYNQLAELLNEQYPNIRIKFNEESVIYTRPAAVQAAKKIYDWVDLHKFQDDLPALVPLALKGSEIKEFGIRKFINTIREIPDIIKWIELILGAILMQLLSETTGTLIQFKYIDFRLLFVVLMAVVYGMRFGLYAAILASLSMLYTWYLLSFDWALLTHNVGNWFPFVVYFTAGLLIGYRHDKKEIEIEYEKKQTNLIYEKYSFLYGVFSDIRALKDEFREQLVGYRHSFGKIFSITQELDTLEEDKVFLNALRILQEIMENETIAIYTIGSNNNYARLEVSAPELGEKLSKSLNLLEFPELLDHVIRGEIFQNTALLDGYPAYISPIMNGDTPVAMIAIWNAFYDQFSLEYYNLFEVICGLIQASLVRASMFLSANLDKMFLPSTRVLNPEAFLEAVRIKEEMRRNKISDFQLIKIQLKGKSYQDIYTQISSKVRATDNIGAHKDGNCYLLLSQADKGSVNDILNRLGFPENQMELIGTNELDFS